MDFCPEGTERHLPADFADRLIANVRARRRRARRAKVLAAIALVIAGSLVCVGFFSPADPKGRSETCLVAAKTERPTERVSGWMLLGVFRECFRRVKATRKKDED